METGLKNMNHRKIIGTRIAELRTQKGWSQADLAKECGLFQGNIARIEAGIYSTGIDLLGRIADALNASLEINPNS